MWYIIIGLIVIGIIGAILSAIGEILSIIVDKLKDIYEGLSYAVGPITVMITLILCIIAFFAFSWKGVFIVAIGGFGIAYFLRKVGEALETHDKNIKETAKINQKTQKEQACQQNEYALREELDKNCRWLGFMDATKWATKLPNYKDKPYKSSFDSITTNFAKQMEEQNILQSDEWFQPFFQYILNTSKSNKMSSTKLLNEVNCPQLQVTHVTPDLELLEAQLKKRTVRVNRDVPPLLKEVLIAGENLYEPTEYALKNYGKSTESEEIHQTEIKFEDL